LISFFENFISGKEIIKKAGNCFQLDSSVAVMGKSQPILGGSQTEKKPDE
jgi:hypothetical protein